MRSDTGMGKPATFRSQPATVPVVRILRLRRRRTNVPWIYSLYHADPKPRRRPAREAWEVPEDEVVEWEEGWDD